MYNTAGDEGRKISTGDACLQLEAGKAKQRGKGE
jgi:hypothetical protein